MRRSRTEPNSYADNLFQCTLTGEEINVPLPPVEFCGNITRTKFFIRLICLPIIFGLPQGE